MPVAREPCTAADTTDEERKLIGVFPASLADPEER